MGPRRRRRRSRRAAIPVHAAAVAKRADRSRRTAYYEGADAASIAASLAAAFPNGAPPGRRARTLGDVPKGGCVRGDDGLGEVDNDNSAWRVSDESRRRWDLPPEVYAAIQTNRASRVGENASFTDDGDLGLGDFDRADLLAGEGRAVANGKTRWDPGRRFDWTT